jgi:hypothetical protein
LRGLDKNPTGEKKETGSIHSKPWVGDNILDHRGRFKLTDGLLNYLMTSLHISSHIETTLAFFV